MRKRAMEEEFTLDESQEAGAAQPTGGLLYTTPQQLLAMDEEDLAGLERLFKQALDRIREIWLLHPSELLFQQALKAIRETGGLRPSDLLQLPVRTSPPTTLQFIRGYEGGALNPHTPGVACIVVPQEQGRGADYTKGPWHFRADTWRSETFEPGLIAVRMSVEANKGEGAPEPPLRFYKFMLDTPPVNFLVSDAAPAAARKHEPYVLMHMRNLLQHTRVAVPQPATAVDAPAHTPADAPPTPPLAAGSETNPERPASPDEVTGYIERLSLAGAASNSDGGEGGGGAAASDGGGAACAEGGTMLARGARCEITGLVAAAQHNATRCTLTEFHKAIGRWEVQLDGGAALRVKPANLIAIVAPIQGVSDEEAGGTMLARGARCEIRGLVAAAQHNGARCTLTEFHEASGRWQVRLDGGPMLGVRAAHLAPRHDTECQRAAWKEHKISCRDQEGQEQYFSLEDIRRRVSDAFVSGVWSEVLR